MAISCHTHQSPLNVSSLGRFAKLSKGQHFLSAEAMQEFLIHDQRESRAEDMEWVKQTMGSCGDVRKWDVAAFSAWLGSADNEAWDTACDELYQDMDQPLSHYWLSSSHNTYVFQYAGVLHAVQFLS